MSKRRDNLSDIWKLKQRGKRDSDRHKELVKRAIKKHGRNIITEYNVITSDGDKKVKVPIRFLDKYRFKYGKRKKKGGTGQGLKGKPGTQYKIGGQKQKGAGKKAGNEPGEKYFEAEVSIDEIVELMLDELNLPWMEPKESTSFIEVDKEEVSSVEKVGIMPNLDIKRSLLENLKRNAAQGDPMVGEFKKEDLRYRTWETEREYHSNAAVYIMRDRSGSMGPDETYICKSFYFWMVQFLKRRYKKIDLVFIAHDTRAYEVTEKEFFTMSSGGGTQCSSAFEMAYNHIQKHHHPDHFCNYIFEFSDGDNWGNDNKLCIDYVKKLVPLATAIGYGEICLNGRNVWMQGSDMLSSMLSSGIESDKFLSVKIESKDDVFHALKVFFAEDIKKVKGKE